MIQIDPKKIKFELAENTQPEKRYPMPLEIMKLLGIAKEINKEDTIKDKETDE